MISSNDYNMLTPLLANGSFHLGNILTIVSTSLVDWGFELYERFYIDSKREMYLNATA